jgi:hypothetical protein
MIGYLIQEELRNQLPQETQVGSLADIPGIVAGTAGTNVIAQSP